MYNEKTIILIDDSLNKKRVDIALSEITKFSRSMIQKLIYTQHITCNNEIINKANKITQIGETYIIIEPKSNLEHIIPQIGKFDILFEDEHIIVINKEASIIVHPGAGNKDNTLINYIAHYSKLSNINGQERLGTVHRLDKGVSGCIVFAKTNAAHIWLANQFQKREIKKEYLAICYNKLIQSTGLMEDFIGRATYERQKMMCYKLNNHKQNGKFASMTYKIINYFYLHSKNEFISQILCFPQTGRMHQIRVQLSSRGIPIIGDTIYGKNQNVELTKILGTRIALHSLSITFKHITNEIIEIKAPVPETFIKLIEYAQTINVPHETLCK